MIRSNAAKVSIYVLFLLISTVAGEVAGTDTVVMLWQQGEAAISLTHDDNRYQHIDIIAPALKARGLRGTFNVIPGFWGGYSRPDFFLAHYPLLAQEGHEIASHTMYHQRCRIMTPEEDPDNMYFRSLEELRQDCVDVKAIIESIQVGRNCVSFTYPGGVRTPETQEIIASFFLSARVSDTGIRVNPSSPPDMYALLPSYIGEGFTDTWAEYEFAYNKFSECIDRALTSGGWVIEEYHDVKSPGYCAVNLQAYYDHLDDLAAAVEAGQLWVAPQGDVARYIYSRDRAEINILPSDPNTIEMIMDDNLPDGVFDVPLTLKTPIPADWTENVTVIHNGSQVGARTLTSQNIRWAMYSVIADGGLIQICQKPFTLFYPNGGECMASGSTVTVRWETATEYDIAGVRLEFSVNDGESWNEIAVVPDTGAYEWNVP